MPNEFSFTSTIWLYPGEAAWYFVSLPESMSAQISDIYRFAKRGWGSLPVNVSIAEIEWKTSIFPDRKTGVYMLPLKAEVRKRLGVKAGDEVRVEIRIVA